MLTPADNATVALAAAASKRPLVLASASPRRQEMLAAAGIAFEVAVSGAEAHLPRAATPQQQAQAGALAKALDIAQQFPGRLVVGADTVVAVGKHLLEKPADAAHAQQMLEQLSGRQHQVHTSFALVAGEVGTPPAVLHEETVTSTVRFRRLLAEDIEAYVRSGDPLDKAGGYGIQSGGGALVCEVIGSYLNVVGLPLARLLRALSALGWKGAPE